MPVVSMECVYADLLGLRSRHSNNAADALSNSLLGDDDKRCSVTRVLQVAADNGEQQQINNCGRQLGGGGGEGENITEQLTRRRRYAFQSDIKDSISGRMPGPHEEKKPGPDRRSV